MQELIADCMDILSASLPADVHLEGPAGDCAPWVAADRSQFEMALINLAINAAEALEKGGGVVAISCREVDLGSETAATLRLAAGRYCRVAVSDTGTGIDPQTLPRVSTRSLPRSTTRGPDLVWRWCMAL